ncbi:helix-turn-helix domain-containing protein [Streptomyces sp. C8S0]|uniref:helix-turn-helix domain-containing protein n=1 Tax=Streptomyces sp. C8S0 TaxID=2585716 RepID=UPI001D041432|nr:helix-turn-helix transcriptional regulator [Streptomyces sp. C8S0]
MDARDDAQAVDQAAEDFAATVAHWREVRGLPKRALALQMGFDPSYVSHIESGRHKPTEDFARRAEETLGAGKAIWKCWLDYEAAKARTAPSSSVPAPRRMEQPYATGSAIVVEHDAARLDYDGRLYRLTMRRLLRNTGTEPITRYLIRISVDRYPGEPERSNAHYRQHPLTWDDLALTATCRGERCAGRPSTTATPSRNCGSCSRTSMGDTRCTQVRRPGSSTHTRSATRSGELGSSEQSGFRLSGSASD